MAFGALSLKGRALRWLSQREHSRVELERKLARHLAREEAADEGTTPEAKIAAVLDELAAAGLISEDRTAASVLHSQGARFGSRRLKQVLQAKGLAPDLVAHTLQQAAGTELDRARAVWRRRFTQAPQDANERARQMRFLLARGFAGELVSKVLREAGHDNADGEPWRPEPDD